MLEIGSNAPLFKSFDQYGAVFDLGTLIQQKYIVLFFYPKDFTPGCTKEACGFAEMYTDLLDQNVEVVGVSGDNEASHFKFSSVYDLPYKLIQDKQKSIRKMYKVPIHLGLITDRVTYIIDVDGKIAFHFKGIMKAEDHVYQVKEFFNRLRNN